MSPNYYFKDIAWLIHSTGQLLSNTLSPDAALRASATQQLETAARDHFDQYMTLLSQQLANEQSPSHIRNASGLALKNALSAKVGPAQSNGMLSLTKT